MQRPSSITAEALPRERDAATDASTRDAAVAARGPRPKLPPVRPVGDHNWLGSSFDLAQGLEVKEMVSKLSPETLDKLFRS